MITLFIRNDNQLYCSLADYARDFGKIEGGRFVQTDEGAYLWHATLKSQAMIGTQLLEIKHPHGTQYTFSSVPELFCAGLGGAGFSLQGSLESAHEHFSKLGEDLKYQSLPPYYEGATKLVSWREVSFDMLLAHVAHRTYRLLNNGIEVPAHRVLSEVIRAIKQVPELYNENTLRAGMDEHKSKLGFTASEHIVVGATDRHSFDNVLLRAIEALAPEQVFALEVEAQER